MQTSVDSKNKLKKLIFTCR